MMRDLRTLTATTGRVVMLGAVLVVAVIAGVYGSAAGLYESFGEARTTIAAVGALALALVVTVWMAGDFGGPIGAALVVASSDRHRIAVRRLGGIAALSAAASLLFTIAAAVAKPPTTLGDTLGLLSSVVAMLAYGLLAGALAMLMRNAVAAFVLFLIVILTLEPIGTAVFGATAGSAIAPDRYIGAVLAGAPTPVEIGGFALLIVAAATVVVWRLLRVRL